MILLDKILNKLNSNNVFLGLDFLNTNIPKYVLLKKSNRAFNILEYGEIGNVDEKLLNLNNLADQTIIALPRNKVILRMITVDTNKTSEIKSRLLDEIAKYAPLPVDEIIFTYNIIKKNKNEFVLLVAIVKKVEIENCLELINKYNLKNVVLDIPSSAIYNCFAFNHKEIFTKQSSCVIDIGQKNVEICIISKGGLVFTKTLNLGVEYIAKGIASELDIDIKTAEKFIFEYKKEFSEKVVASEINQWGDKLLKEIEICLNFYKIKYQATQVKGLFIGGCGENLFDIIEDKFKKLKIPRKKIDPFFNVSYKKENKQNNNIFFIPMGLALHGYDNKINIDFFPKNVKVNLKLKKIKKIIVTASIGFFMLFICSLLCFLLINKYYTSKINKLKKQYSIESNEISKQIKVEKCILKKN
jgi:type IV pilus assembly protein PilM